MTKFDELGFINNSMVTRKARRLFIYYYYYFVLLELFRKLIEE